MKMKKINLSESVAKNSSAIVPCNFCSTTPAGEKCGVCHGAGEISIAKASRLKESKKAERI